MVQGKKKVRVRGLGSHELAWLLAYILTWRHSCRQAGGSRPCTRAPGTHCHLKQWQYFLPVEIVTLCHLKYWYSGIWNSDFLPSGTESRVTHKGLTNRVHAVIWKGSCGHLKQSTRNMLVFESIIKAPKTCYHLKFKAPKTSCYSIWNRPPGICFCLKEIIKCIHRAPGTWL